MAEPGNYNELDAFRGDLSAPDGGLEPTPSYVLTTGRYTNPDWIVSLDFSKITGVPSFASTWGSITGTLSNQTDLQTALNARQPLDADLTALAALTGTNTIYYRSAANTWTAVTVGSGLGFSGGTLTATAAPIGNPNVAYVNETGNDATAELGNPAKPFLTWQAAFDHDPNGIFEFGYAASIGDLDVSASPSSNVTMYIRGVGLYSSLGNIVTGGKHITIYDIGVKSAPFGNIVTAPPGATPSNSGTITLYDVWCIGTVDSRGKTSTDTGGTGSVGGTGGDVIFYGSCKINNVITSGGAGGPGDGVDPGGNGGSSGSLTIEGQTDIEGTLILTGGLGGTDGGAGAGSNGANGAISSIPFGIPTPVDPASETYVGAIVNGVFRGDVVGNATTATTLQNGRTIAITGDLAYTSPSFDGSGNVTAGGTLATVNSNVGSFTFASITVNGKGLITAASSASLGMGIGTFLTTPSSANLASAVTDETGSGALVFATSPTFVTPLLGTPTSGTLTNCTIPAGQLTGTTLAATVVTSSITTVGTLVGGATGAGFTVALSTSTITGTLADARLPATVANITSMTALATISGVTTLTGAASNMTIVAGTGNSRTMILQTTTSGGTATTALTLNANQSATFASTIATTGLVITEVAGTGAITITGATQTTSKPVFTATQTWNAGGVTFSGIGLNVTDTASATGSTLIDLQLGGNSQFQVKKIATGLATLIAGYSGNKKMSLIAGTTASAFEYDSAGSFYIQSAANASVGSGGGTIQMSIAGGAAANALVVDASSNLKVGGGIIGVTTNSNAGTGIIGEYSTSAVPQGSAVSLTTASPTNLTSVSLTAGDWDVSGNINYSQTTATVTSKQAGISSSTGALPTDGSEVYSGSQFTLISAIDGTAIPRKRFSLSGTTSVFLVGSATFSAGTVVMFGSITARRVR